MKKAPENDHIRLLHILEAAEKAIEYTAGHTQASFIANELLQLGIARLVEIIGEASRQLSDDFIQANPQIPWQEIMGMRNRLAHAYIDVDLNLLWDMLLFATSQRSSRNCGGY